MFNPVLFYEAGKLDRLICFEDTYIDGGAQSTNFSNSDGIVVKNEIVSNTRRSFIQFKSLDFSKFSKLQIYQRLNSAQTNIIPIVVDLMPNIDLGALTYLIEPSPITLSIASFNCLPSIGWIEIDIQSFLTSYTQQTLTFRFRTTAVNSRAITFNSKETLGNNRGIYLIK